MFLILACKHHDYYNCDYGLGMTIITTKDKDDSNDDNDDNNDDDDDNDDNDDDDNKDNDLW